ncbi:hypothetical protein L596_002987 [Steinernema carpocapsae]|uniref:HOOK N-terminal domain-containing protein n=1 Tax=Steinernema carpocapsae TaxID=34508 RepID=A0A4U8URT0_STECR|nr:hypothetical protein L596_002987 [Steinernema carpocapsae]
MDLLARDFEDLRCVNFSDQQSRFSQEFYNGLVKWMQTIGTESTIDTICSGRDVAMCLHHIAPEFFSGEWLQSTQIDGDSNIRVKASNIRKICRRLNDYFDEVLKRNLRDSEKWTVDASKIAEYQDRAHIEKLLVLLFSAATLGPNSTMFVQQLSYLQLNPVVQKELMSVLTEINEDMPEARSDKPNSERKLQVYRDSTVEHEEDKARLNTRISSYQVQIKTLRDEKEELESQLNDANSKLLDFEIAQQEIHAYKRSMVQLQEQLHQHEAGIDFKDTQIQKLNSELERCNETIRKLEDNSTADILNQVSDENLQLTTQIKVLKERLTAAEQGLSESESLRPKLKEINVLKSENKVLKEKMENYIATAVAYEDDKRRNEVLKVQFEALRLHMTELEAKLTEETVMNEKIRYDLAKARKRLEEVENEKKILIVEQVHLKSEIASQNSPSLEQDLEMSGHNGSTLEPLELDERIDFQLKTERLRAELTEMKVKHAEEREDLERQMLELSTELRISKEKIGKRIVRFRANNAQKLYESTKTDVGDRISNEKMSVTITRLERELKETAASYDGLQKTVAELRNEVAAKNEQISTVERTYREYLEKAQIVISDMENSQNSVDFHLSAEYRKLVNEVKAKDKKIVQLTEQLDTSRILNEQEQRLMTSSYYKMLNDRHADISLGAVGATLCADGSLSAGSGGSENSKWPITTTTSLSFWIFVGVVAALIPALGYLMFMNQRSSGPIYTRRGFVPT